MGREIRYISKKKNVENIQVSLKSNKNKGYFTWRPIYIFDRVSLNASYNDTQILQTNFVDKI